MHSLATNRSAFIAALFVVCCGQAPADSEIYASAETIEVGCGGGIAGIIEFVSVHRDGRVDYNLKGFAVPPPGPDSVTKAKVDGWFAALEAARFFEHESPERENYPDAMHCGILLVGPRHSHYLELESAPAWAPELRRVFEEVGGLIPGK
jgi:hypothetical protein